MNKELIKKYIIEECSKQNNEYVLSNMLLEECLNIINNEFNLSNKLLDMNLKMSK